MRVRRDSGFCPETILFWICGAFAVAVFFVGMFGLLAPVSGAASFGVPVSVNDLSGQAWVRLMGVRDVALSWMLAIPVFFRIRQVVGFMMLLMAIVPAVDCAAVLIMTGFVPQVLLHGSAVVVMLVTGRLLVRR